ncbi:MAG TPA: nuclear transport factor 2 family protein [Acidimicrobiia bacterium]|nr:nuclear transport factor 2 family protein [Acidimicrobiia bacterium]
MSAGVTVEELLAREEITDVVKRLARGTDRLDEELIATCYHDDGVDDHNVFRGDGRAFARWVVETLPHFAATMHFVGPPFVRLDGDVAHVDTYCVAHHVSHPDDAGDQTDMVLGLRYVDRFERRDGRWLIARRVCAFDWSTTVTTPAAQRFAFAEGWTIGARDRSDIAYSGV